MVEEIEFTQFSRNKLRIIHKYYSEKASSLVAQRLIQNIVDSTSNLKQFPESGQIEGFHTSKYEEFRSVKFKTYKVLYVILKTKVVVVNIFDMRQNPNKLDKEMKMI